MQKPNVFKGFLRVLSGGDGRGGLRPMFEAFFFAHWSGGPAVSTAASPPARSPGAFALALSTREPNSIATRLRPRIRANRGSG
jgi:hypothetical protein